MDIKKYFNIFVKFSLLSTCVIVVVFIFTTVIYHNISDNTEAREDHLEKIVINKQPLVSEESITSILPPLKENRDLDHESQNSNKNIETSMPEKKPTEKQVDKNKNSKETSKDQYQEPKKEDLKTTELPKDQPKQESPKEKQEVKEVGQIEEKPLENQPQAKESEVKPEMVNKDGKLKINKSANDDFEILIKKEANDNAENIIRFSKKTFVEKKFELRFIGRSKIKMESSIGPGKYYWYKVIWEDQVGYIFGYNFK